MPVRNSFRHLAFRVHLTPAPRTQSESNAVLAVLRDFGPVATFQVRKPGLLSPIDHVQHTTPAACVASLVFAQHTKSIAELRNNTRTQSFRVTANTDVPDPNVEDPYNVRGLKYRKPEFASRTIQCRIVPVEADQDDGVNDDVELRSTSAAAIIAKNEYANPFAVDRSSIFAEILARTDCPSGLIHGLLPKLRDEHRVLAWSDQPADSSGAVDDHDENDDENHETRNTARQQDLQGSQGQRANRRTEFVSLKLDSGLDLDGHGPTKERKVDSEKAKPVEFHDEFASLRKFSLMGMYRRGVLAGREKEKEVKR